MPKTKNIGQPQDQYELALYTKQQREARDTEDFNAHMETKGVGYRKAMNLIAIVNAKDRLGYTDDEVRELTRELGWTKVSLMLRGMKKKRSVNRLIQDYRDVTVPKVKQDFPSPNPRKNSKTETMFAVYMTQARHNKLMRVLHKHGMPKSEGKNVGQSAAFDRLVSEL